MEGYNNKDHRHFFLQAIKPGLVYEIKELQSLYNSSIQIIKAIADKELNNKEEIENEIFNWCNSVALKNYSIQTVVADSKKEIISSLSKTRNNQVILLINNQSFESTLSESNLLNDKSLLHKTILTQNLGAIE